MRTINRILRRHHELEPDDLVQSVVDSVPGVDRPLDYLAERILIAGRTLDLAHDNPLDHVRCGIQHSRAESAKVPSAPNSPGFTNQATNPGRWMVTRTGDNACVARWADPDPGNSLTRADRGWQIAESPGRTEPLGLTAVGTLRGVRHRLLRGEDPVAGLGARRGDAGTDEPEGGRPQVPGVRQLAGGQLVAARKPVDVEAGLAAVPDTAAGTVS